MSYRYFKIEENPDILAVHDYDKRFALEDEGLLDPNDSKFRWFMLDAPLQYKMVWD